MSQLREQSTFVADAIAAAVLEYGVLAGQGGAVSSAAFGVAVVELQARLNVSLEAAAVMLERALE